MAASRTAVCLVGSALGLASFLAGGAQVQDRAQSMPPAARPNAPAHSRAAHHFLAERGLAEAPASPAALLRRARQQRQLLPKTSGSASTPTWIPAGPTQVITAAYGAVTGRITSVAVDPSDTSGNTVYFGSTGGGVWKSTNAKTGSPPTFQPLTDTLAAFTQGAAALTSISIGALTVQPGQTGVILAGTGDTNDALDSYYGGGILRSTDNGNTWALIPGSSDAFSGYVNYSFNGEGFAGFAWSTANSQLVVAAVSQSAEGLLVNAQSNTYTVAGLYYSSDAGAHWHLASIEDQNGQYVQSLGKTFQPPGNPATAVVWNPIRQRFYAAVRFHGYYESTDAITWTRLANQPGASLSTTACPTNPGLPGSQTCPIFRGALAVQPVTGDIFALTTDLNNGDQGLFQDKCSPTGLAVTACASSTVAFGTQLDSTPFEVGGGDTTIPQADYNLALAAVPQQQDTLVFVGTEDIFRCSLANACAWRNTTNVNTCASAMVAPAQHAFESTFGNTGLLYFGGDGGLWSTRDAVAQTGSVCAATDAAYYQNLNPGIGSLAEVAHFAVDPANSALLLAGIGGFGTAASESAASEAAGSTAAWQQVLTGESGFVAIDPATPQNWYADAGAGVTIHRCTGGSTCTASGFGAAPVVGRTQVDDDADYEYTPAPWLLDPFNTANLLVGTCRIWRGPATGAGWSSANLLSPMLDGNQQPMCNSNAILRSLAASGNLPAATGSEHLYAGMYGYGINGGSIAAGHLYGTTVTQSSGLFTWTDLWNSPVTNNSSSNGRFNPGNFSIPSIAVDPHDSSGQTVYAAIQGFPGNGINSQLVYRSTDGGAHWLDISGGLPLAPVNSILVDPNQAQTVYLATDTGVYVTQTVSTCGVQNCWAVYGTGLPNAPVTELKLFNNGSGSVLLAATYGRGIWKIGLLTSPQNATATLTPTSLTFAAEPLNMASAAQAVTLTNTGTVALAIASIAVSAQYSQNNNCPASLAVSATCTIQVSFTPTSAGTQTGLLTVSANVSGGQLTATLNGTGQAPGVLSLAPASLTFASAVVGQTTASQLVTATNSGGTAILVGTPIVTGDYALTANTCTGATLAPTATCTLQLDFAPTRAGDRPGLLTVPSNAPGTAPSVSLDGTGIASAALTLAPSPASFPTTAVGSTSAPQTITVTSSGGVAAQLGTPSVSANYAISSSTCGATLAPSTTCTLQVTFAPSATGSRSGLLTVPATNIAGGQVTDTLSGAGAAPAVLTLTPSPASFPATAVGSVSAPVAITVAASGGVPAQLGTPGVSAGFTLASTTCAATLAPGSACAINVTFAPSASGAQTGTLTLPAPNVSGGQATDALTGTGLAPAALSLSPSSLTFPVTATGTTAAAQTITVTSSGGLPVQLGTPSVTANYAISSNTCTGALAPAASCTVQITFSPTTTGSLSGTLTVPASNIAGGKITASLNGTGATPGHVTLTPASQNFGSVAIGSSSASVTFTATNSGGAAVTLQSPSVTGDYAVTSTTCAASLASAATCTLQVAFSPTSLGSRTGTLSLAGTFSASPATAALTGTGVAPASLSFTPSPVAFPGTIVGANSAAQTVTLTNSGGVPAPIGTPSVTAGFAVNGTNCGATLLAGASCTLSLTFHPTALGATSGMLTMPSSSITGGQVTDALSGTGLPSAALTIAPLSFNFGSVAVGAASAAETFTVTSTGGAAAQLTAPSVSSSYSIDSTTCGTSLAPSATCTIQVRFAPTALGASTGVLTVPASNIAGGKTTATLSGTGLAPPAFTVTPGSLQFGSVSLGSTSAAETVTLSSTGGAAVQLGTPSISTTAYQLTASTCGATLPPSASCTLQVVFHPAATGDQPATLSIPSNIAASPTAVGLDGTGLPAGALSLSPTSLSFSPAAVGTPSAAKNITVSNTGGAAVQLGAVTATPSDYQVTSNSCGSSLAPGATCLLQVVFTPTQPGSRPGTLTVPGSSGAVSATLGGSGLSPGNLSLAPSTASFGSVAVGSTSPFVTITATNSGGVAVTLQTPTISGDFAIASNNCGSSLSPGFSCTLQLTFTPTAAGSRTGTLSLGGSFSGSPAAATLSGTGLAPGNLSLAPATHSFGGVVVGASSASVTFIATNSGGAAVTLQSPVTTGDFAILSSTCGSSLAAAATCSTLVTFTPTALGSRAGTLSIAGSFAASPATAALTGTGLAPGNLALAPSTYNFGSVVISTTSASATFTATNSGGAAVTLQTPTLSGDFSLVATTCGASLAPSGSCSVQVAFTPTLAGARSGTLSIGGSFPGSPATASLTGTGVSAGNLALSPTSESFGAIAVGSTSAPVTVTATNSGGAAVSLGTPTLTGDFAVATTTCGVSLAGGSSCSLQLTFTPSASGSRVGTLTLPGNFPGSPATVALSGTGITPASISLAPSALAFGSVVVGNSALATITVTNTGGASAPLQPPSVAGDYSVVANACTSTLAPGANCSIEISFAPSAPGSRPGTLSLAGSFPGSPATATLSGTGIAPGTLTLSPASLNFGSVPENTTSASSTITATNTGGAAVTIQSPSVTGAYRIASTTCGASVAAGAGCSVAITFTPTTLADSPGLLTIAGSLPGGQVTAALDGIGIAPAMLSFTPAQLAFGAVVEGTTSPAMTLTLSNTGSIAAPLGAATVTGDYAIHSKTCGSSLAANASCTFALTFTPTSAGDRAGTLSVAGSFAGSPLTAALDGQGVAPGVLVLSPTSLTFAAQVETTTSAPQSVTLSNTGGTSVPVPAPSLTGDYALASTTCPGTLSAGSSCALGITFTPKAAGARAGTLSVSASTVQLVGTGLSPAALSLTPTSLSFGSLTQGSVSAPQTLTVTNTGGVTAAIQAPSVSGDYQITTNSCGSTLEVGATCTLQIDFAPSGTGNRPGLLTLLVPAPGTGAAAVLDGTGLAPSALVLTPASLTFVATAVGAASPVGNISVANTSNAAIPLGAPQLTGNFALSADTCGTSLPTQTSCTLSITFTPTAAGARTGMLTIASGSIAANALLSGVGLAPATDILAPVALTFPVQTVGTVSPAQAVTLTNAGDLTLSSISVSVSGPFVVANNCGATLAGHASCGIAVAYVPTTTGPQTGMLSVTDFQRTQTVALSGTGSPPLTAFATPSSLNFGGYASGGTTPPQTVTITNNGQSALDALAIHLTGSAFTLSANTCPGILAQGASCTLALTFSPPGIGPQGGQVLVTSTSLPQPLAVNLSGSGEDFQISVQGAASAVITPGQSATFQVQVTPTGASLGALTLACSGVPANTTCSVDPASLTVGNGATGSATVTLVTSVGTASLPRLLLKGSGALALLLPFCFSRRSRRVFALLLLAAALALLPTACGVHSSAGANSTGSGSGGGGGGTQTPPGSYPVTVTAAFPGAQRTATFTLIVQ